MAQPELLGLELVPEVVRELSEVILVVVVQVVQVVLEHQIQ